MKNKAEEFVIGLEIHLALNTKSKLFCGCSTNISGVEPNSLCCPTCLGLPGSKPRVNKRAIDFGIMVAKALNCEINPRMFFSRKSYFYPDMPKNFQISQYELPLAKGGYLKISEKKIGIRRIQIEEDPGRLIHVGGDITSAEYVLVDYNRSGIPLLEIVTEPDFTSTGEVKEFLSKLSMILQYLGAYDPKKEASMRIDANISMGGGRVEVKNITGFKAVESALSYEIIRQRNIMRRGGKVVRETRHFDPVSNTTRSLRAKEMEEDYGFILDTDLAEVAIDEKWIKDLENKIPELPDERVRRFVEEYKISERNAKVIVYTDKAFADFFEKCCEIYDKPTQVANWMVTDLLKSLNYNKISIDESEVEPEGFVEILKMIDEGKISGRIGKELVKRYVASGKNPREIVEEEDLTVLRGREELEEVVKKVLKENKNAVEDYRKGNKKAIEFLIGKALAKTGGRADPKLLREILLEFLK